MANIPENTQLHELPAYWREQIRKLRSENFELRKRLKQQPNQRIHELEARRDA